MILVSGLGSDIHVSILSYYFFLGHIHLSISALFHTKSKSKSSEAVLVAAISSFNDRSKNGRSTEVMDDEKSIEVADTLCTSDCVRREEGFLSSCIGRD